MATIAFASSAQFRRLSLGVIDAVVSARLGTTRIPGNAQPACFNRQVAMYLAKYVAGWSTTCIGRFYNGRDHSTVVHGIQRIQALRESDPAVDALLSELRDQLTRSFDQRDNQNAGEIHNPLWNSSGLNLDELAEAIADRLWARIKERLKE